MFSLTPQIGSYATKTAPELGELASQAGSILVVPVGAIEQHGPHLPVATDSLLVSATTSTAVDGLADDQAIPIVDTPTVWSGDSSHHLAFGGTLSSESGTLQQLLTDIVKSGLENDFDAVVLVNGHAGNASVLSTAVNDIGADTPSAEVLGLTYFDLVDDRADSFRDSDTGGMGHGGEFETSLMLHLYPDLVREDRQGIPLDEPYERGISDLMEGASLSVYRPIEAYTETGAIGAPDLATAEKGEEFFDIVVEELSDLLETVYKRNQ